MDNPVHNLSRIFQMQSNEDRLNSTSFNSDRDMNVLNITLGRCWRFTTLKYIVVIYI